MILGTAACAPIDAPPSGGEEIGEDAAEARRDLDPDCTFERGVTTCVTVTERTETGTHQAFSGCVAFNGTEFVAGRRVRTFADTFLVTETTTTLQHGMRGAVFDTSVAEERALISSVEINSVCEPS